MILVIFVITMAKKEFIPIPPPAPIPDPEYVDIRELYLSYKRGDIDIICVMGPTASGKTRYAVALARQLNKLCAEDGAAFTGAEILSGDSRQVYTGMDLGTGKDIEEYGEIPYHLIDIVPAGSRYDICQYQRDFSAAYAGCLERKVIPILCGGSGLYIEAVTKDEYQMKDNMDLELTLPKHAYYMATVVDRETRRERIDKRLVQRFEQGMLMEIKGLMAKGISSESLIYYGLEYKFITLYLLGELTVEEMFSQLQIAIHKFAKRQMTWLRGMERDGVKIHWVDAASI